MKNEKSLIEVVASLPLIFHEHLDSLNMGDTVTRSPTIYRHIETGEEYVNLAGAIAWPGKELPGFILVIGVRVDPASENILYNCIDEAEDHCIENLLVKCITLRNRYGFRQSQKLFRFWYGDSIRFVSLVTQFNQQLRDDKKTERIYLANPIDFEKVNHFELYLRRTQSALMLNGTGRKTLFLGNCHRLRNTLQSLPPDAALRFTDDDSPAVAALGSLLHSLMMGNVWAWRASELSTRSDLDDFESYALKERRHDPFFQDYIGHKMPYARDLE